LIAHSGWPQLQTLLLQLLAAFENEKLVSDVAAGSAVGRQAQAVAALQQQLTSFLAACLSGLSEQQQFQQQQQQQQQGKQNRLVASFLTAYLDRVVEVSERAPTAAVLLQAVADAAAAAADPLNSTGTSGSSSSTPNTTLCDLDPQQLLAHVGAVLAHVNYLHPAYMRPQIQRALLQLVPLCCIASSCGGEVPLSLLATSGNTAAAEAGCFMQWLDAAFSAPAEQAAAAPASGSLSQLQVWLQPLQQSSSTAALPQLKLLQCLGLAAAGISSSNQQAVAAVLLEGATAVGQSAAAVGGAQASVIPPSAAVVTALACLACGVAASLQPTTSEAAAAASTASNQGMSAAVLNDSLQQLVPALLRYHKTVHAAAGVYDITWLTWLAQLLQNALNAPPPAAADVGQRQQLQSAVLTELVAWQQQLAADVVAAAAAAELDQQLLQLSTAHMTCFSLQCNAEEHSLATTTGVAAAELDSCLLSLCQLVPGSGFSDTWTAEMNSSNSSSRLEMTDALMQLRMQLMAQLVAAAAGEGSSLVSVGTQQQVFDR
jgi:hypothetical protein